MTAARVPGWGTGPRRTVKAPAVDPAVVALAREAGYVVVLDAHAVHLREAETELVARVDGGDTCVLGRSTRGSAPRAVVRSQSWLAVELVLCDIVGQDWRAVQGLPFLDTVGDGVAPAGVEVVPAEGSRHAVRWAGGEAAGLYRGGAVTLARALVHPVAVVAASYRDPDGLPAFPAAGVAVRSSDVAGRAGDLPT